MAYERFCLDVALGTSEDQQQNVVVLSGVDLEVRLEADLDGDPLQDDLLRLESAQGSCWILTAGNPDVRLDLDKKHYVYTYRAVPNGLYTISVKQSNDEWAPVVTGILVNKSGALLRGKALTDQDPPPRKPAPPPEPEPEAEPEPLPEGYGATIDEDHVL